MIRKLLLSVICAGTLLGMVSLTVAQAQSTAAQTQVGSVHGTVTDPAGAVLPASTVTLISKEGAKRTATANATGGYSFDRVEPGRYTITASAEGFAPFAPVEVLVYGGKSALQNLSLQLPVEVQQVQVDSQSMTVDTTAENNASAILIKGKDLDSLSDDPDELENELSALAGPSAGPNGGQIYIGGFTGGQLPPKSSIREIRVNQNPFSAQYDRLGYGRIEILTKPGTDKLHGMFTMNGNNSSFNSLSPFVTSVPPYYSTFMMGNISGSMNKNASWFGSVFRRDNHTDSIVNAIDPVTGSNFTAGYSNPQSRLDVSPRLDFQLGAKNTLTVRYMFDRNIQTNGGVSGFSLVSQAYDSTGYENTLQLSDTQVLSTNVVNETHFQYMRDRNSMTARNNAPTISVSGAFTTGGNSMGKRQIKDDSYEFQNVTMVSKGAHSINFGGRLRYTRDSNYSVAGFNGTFMYNCYTSTAYCSNAYVDKKPSQYSITIGTGAALVNYYDVGLFYQDDYKASQNVTLSYGLRYETQNNIGDHNDWAPRFAFAWAPFSNAKKHSGTVIRGGYGWFYDRFGEGNVLQSIRYNGTTQKQYIVKNPNFSELDNPNLSEIIANNVAAPTIYQIAPKLKAAVNMQTAIGVEQQIGKFASLAATFINSRGQHQFRSENINAYDPSTYNVVTGTGTRPNGINENIYQYQSEGAYKENQLMVNYTVNAKRVSLYGFYTFSAANANTSGAGYFPSNALNPNADYGRASFEVRHRFLLGGNLTGPFGISMSPMLSANSGMPFNITIGQDLNGDNQYNDRPAFATASSTNTITTAYGTFDLNPAWNAARIPFNVGTGPNEFSLNMRVSKSFGIGPRVADGRGPRGGGMGMGPGGPPPGGGMGGGRGMGMGGFGGGARGPRMDQAAARRYSLSFSAQGRNIFNTVNFAAPVGMLNSPLFGKSTSLAGGMFGSQSSNRSIDLQASFSF